jgi:predicted aspartyl protease
MELKVLWLHVRCITRQRRRVGLALRPRLAFFWLVAVLFCLGKSEGHEPPELLAADSVLAQFKIEKRGAPIVLPVTIGDSTYPFLLDTGAVVCVFDDSLRPQLELAPDAKIPLVEGPLPGKLYRPPPMRLGPLLVGPKVGFVFPGFHDTFAPVSTEVYGVIGMNALHEHVLSVDFDSGIIRFLRRATGSLGTPIRLELKFGTYHAIGEIAGNNAPEAFLIDTGHCGFNSGSVRKDLFDQMLASGTLGLFTDRRDTALTSDGIVATRVAQARGFSLGPFKHDRVIISDTATSSKVGLGYLSRFMVTFDFPRSTMYLRPGKEFNRADRCGLDGFGIARIDGKTLVCQVDGGSAAAAAGLKKWDELVPRPG